jgi:hypothetical protein
MMDNLSKSLGLVVIGDSEKWRNLRRGKRESVDILTLTNNACFNICVSPYLTHRRSISISSYLARIVTSGESEGNWKE